MSDTNVAQDQIKAFVDRILRMKEERKAIDADIREIYAEAKGNGFDKTVLGKLVTYVEKRQTDASAVLESESLFDLYLTAYDGASGKVGTKRATHTHASERPDPIAALRADPAMAIVDVANLKKNTEPQPAQPAGQADTAQGPVASSSVENEAAEISTPITEHQPSQPAGSDLAVPQGQVATYPVAKAADDANSGSAMSEVPAMAGAPEQAEVASRVAGDRAPAATSEAMDETAGETANKMVVGKSVGASASAAPASKYAEPGEITWETHPPEGVERGAISMAFGTMGQDTAVIADELERGAAQPIVKKGNIILDGWARYMLARNMRELDGSPMAYPIVQYAGSDLLVDIIKLNIEGRILTEQQKRLIAANLSRQEPSRKEDIYRAFELWIEPV